jgi:hypothetical protein
MKQLAMAFLFGAVLAPACSPPNVSSVDAGPSVDKACSDSAYARCTRAQACSPTGVQLRYGDVTTCETVMKANCVAILAAPGTGSTPSSSEACSQAIPNWDCADYLQTQNPPPECVQATGSIANGAACAYPSQCQSGFCAIAPGAPCGACTTAPQVGDSCAQLTSCGQTLICNAISSTCFAPPATGASCAPGQGCVPGSECLGSSTTTGAAGTCVPAVESLGAACSNTTALCDSFSGLTCNLQSDKCVASQLGTAGQACNFVASQNVVVQCGGGGRCITSGTQSTCTAASTIGGPCDLVAGPECIAPSRCIVDADAGTSGTCQIADGTACQ